MSGEASALGALREALGRVVTIRECLEDGDGSLGAELLAELESLLAGTLDGLRDDGEPGGAR